MTIIGTNLSDATSVEFGSAAAALSTVGSDTSVTTVSPPEAGGVDVGAIATEAMRTVTNVDPPSALRFSLIIVTKGRPRPLRSALESSAKVLPVDCEVIVVDGDPERSAEGVVHRLRSRYPTVDMRYLPSHPGMTLQRNVGIDAAGGDVLVFIDDDCRVEPGVFETLMSAYQDPSVVGATGRVDAPRSRRLGSQPHSSFRRLVLGGGPQGTVSSFGFRCPIVDVEQPRDVEFMPGAFMSARRDVAARVRFDERLTGYCLGEDDDFAYRLSRQGRIRYEPSALVHHHELGWRNMDRREIDRLQVVNRAYLFRKNFSQTCRAKAGFAALMGLLCAHRALNRDWSGLRGLLEGLSHVCRQAATPGGHSEQSGHISGAWSRTATPPCGSRPTRKSKYDGTFGRT